MEPPPMFSLSVVLHTLTALSPATLAGALAVAVNCCWPLQRNRRVILGLQCAGSLLFGLHYLLLGAPTAAAMCAAGVMQGASAALISSRRIRVSIFVATIAAGVATTIAMFAGVTSVLAQTGALLSATGRLQRAPQAIRWCFLGSEVFWISHNLMVGSRWGLTSDTLGVTMLLIGLWRGRAQGAGLRGMLPWRSLVADAAASQAGVPA
jgi:Bacterial inner membrane protein